MSNILKTLPVTNLLFSTVGNVRKTPGSEQDDQSLIASIRANGLINNLIVVPSEVIQDRYDVIAGGRRLLALESLIEQGDLPADHAVPCQIISGNVEEISLAENIVRADMHPIDEFEAFVGLHDAGQDTGQIALRFGITPHYIRQRLRLGRVAEPIRQACRSGEIDLDALMAFTVTEDQARQLAVFQEEGFHGYHRSIRRALMDTKICSSDNLVMFVGMDAYSQAGGTYTEDLFSAEENRYTLDDPALVSELAQQKLDQQADILQAEGWNWADAMLSFYYYDHTKEFPHRLYPDGDAYTAEQKAQSGCIVTIGYGGELKIEAGLQRKDAVPCTETTNKSYSQVLNDFLTNQRLALVGSSLAQNFAVSFDLMLFTLLKNHLRERGANIINISPNEGSYVNDGNEAIALIIPIMPEFWDYREMINFQLSDLAQFSIEQKQQLFAHCTSLLLIDDDLIDDTASRCGLEAVKVWRPTVANFWSRLKKVQILNIAAEVLGQKWADTHTEQKKADLAVKMENIFAGDSVPGVDGDQSARAKVWMPEAMLFGKTQELPTLAADNVSSDEPLILDERLQVPSEEPRLKEEQKVTASLHRLHYDKDGNIYGVQMTLDDIDPKSDEVINQDEQLPEAFLA